MDNDSDSRSCFELVQILTNDFTSLETKSKSRNRSVASPKLPVWIREWKRELRLLFLKGYGGLLGDDLRLLRGMTAYMLLLFLVFAEKWWKGEEPMKRMTQFCIWGEDDSGYVMANDGDEFVYNCVCFRRMERLWQSIWVWRWLYHGGQWCEHIHGMRLL